MSRVKKAVLLVIVVFAMLLITMPANASGSAKIGGVFVNSDSATVTGSLNTQWEQGKWQQTFESDFQYKKEDDEETLNEIFLNTKANYTFLPKHYVFAVAQYDYDKFRADGDRKVLGNSLWLTYKVSTNVSFINKLLYEEGSESGVFIRNETSLNYNFENGTILSLNNTYTEDPMDNNVLSISLGRKW